MEDQMQHEQASPAVQKRVQDSFDLQGLMSHLGARITRLGPGRVHIVLPARPEAAQQHGYVHAGATSAIVDSAGSYAALALFDGQSEVLTVEYKTNLLAPAAGDHLETIGTVVKSGRTLTVCQSEVYGVQTDGTGKLVANSQRTLVRVNRTAQ
ncbi:MULTISPECIES: PaaI family thioesterase [Streptomyces]|uniref:Phenylacetic acid degradation protein PaaI n=1 Tax=Streptomyces viridochromogenes TaxID=1938 RepID=A0A0L8K9B0_STRVR|nr:MULTISPECIES: PaaI family thioesterase [Streptomyces]KOG22562.1 phenylacetic acid degradation protein PaaI [Streptomyces viridochromogenes]